MYVCIMFVTCIHILLWVFEDFMFLILVQSNRWTFTRLFIEIRNSRTLSIRKFLLHSRTFYCGGVHVESVFSDNHARYLFSWIIFGWKFHGSIEIIQTTYDVMMPPGVIIFNFTNCTFSPNVCYVRQTHLEICEFPYKFKSCLDNQLIVVENVIHVLKSHHKNG